MSAIIHWPVVGSADMWITLGVLVLYFGGIFAVHWSIKRSDARDAANGPTPPVAARSERRGPV